MGKPTDKWFSMRTDFFGADAYHAGLYNLSGKALGVYVAGIAWASRWGLDYCYANVAIEVLGRRDSKVIKELVDNGFWVKGERHSYFIAHEGHLWRRGTPLQRRPIPASLRGAVYERDGYQCVFCGNDAFLTLDHIWPYSKGGADEMSNLRTLCRSCNSAKGAKIDGS